MPPLPKQKHGSIFGDKLSNFTSKFKRKEGKISEVTSPIPSESSKLILRATAYLSWKMKSSSVSIKIEILNSLPYVFYGFYQLAWCFCFKLNYLPAREFLLYHLESEVLFNSELFSQCSVVKLAIFEGSTLIKEPMPFVFHHSCFFSWNFSLNWRLKPYRQLKSRPESKTEKTGYSSDRRWYWEILC